MSFESFTTQQGFSTNINDLSSKIGVKNSAAVKKNKLESFKAAESAAQSAEDKKQFTDFMDSLKKKQNANQNKSASQKTEENTKEDSPTSLARFQTQHSATGYSEFTSERTDISITSLTLLSEKLQALIDEQSGQAENTSSGLIQVLDSSDTKTEDADALRALLGALITEIQGKGETTSETDNISTESTDNLLTLLGGLSPQEITDLKAQINVFLTSEMSNENKDALTALINQFYPLTQPNNKAEKSQGTTANTISENVLKTDLQANPNNTKQQQEQHVQGRHDTRYDGRYDGIQPAQDEGINNTFKSALRNNVDGKNIGNASPTAQNNEAAGQRFLQTTATFSSAMGGLESALPQNGLTVASTAPTAMQSALTNITTQAPSAGANHPATQLVSMTIQKAVKAGEDTNIKLRLDPPDLGRVEVKMSIDKDSTTKIVLTAEKPETFMMLQRDSDALHRALAEAGIDMGGDLGFELASEDHEFNQSHENGSGKLDSDKGSADEEEQIIQSTMNWHVDPDTGRMRYNIVV